MIKCKDKDRYYVFVDGKPTGMTCPTERIETRLGPHTVEVYDLVTETRRKWDITVTDTRLSYRVASSSAASDCSTVVFGVVVERRVAVELVARIEAVLADQLAQVLAIDLRLARRGRQVHLVAAHQVLDVLALEHLDELTLRLFERQVGADAERRLRAFADRARPRG